MWSEVDTMPRAIDFDEPGIPFVIIVDVIVDVIAPVSSLVVCISPFVQLHYQVLEV